MSTLFRFIILSVSLTALTINSRIPFQSKPKSLAAIRNGSIQASPDPKSVQKRGKTYYVSANGSDRNPGTEARPFATIQKAADLVEQGDTVIVGDGLYTISSNGRSACGEYKAIVCLNRGGTPTNYVTFRSRNKWGAKLDGQNGTAFSGFAFYGTSDYVRVQDFEIFGMSNDGSSDGIDIYHAGLGAIIVGNHIHDIGHTCTDTSNGQAGIFVQRNNVTIEQNVIHDIGRFSPGESGCHPTSPSYQNHDHAIYLSGNSASATERANGTIIRNNIFYNIGYGFQVHIYHGQLSNILVANNTFAFANPYKDGQLVIYGLDLADTAIVNNIFYQPGKSAIITGKLGTTTHVTISNNLTTAGKLVDSPAPGGIVISNNLVSEDPLLVDPAKRDFHLRSGSAAIDAGLTLRDVSNDFDGRVRPHGRGYDIGAFEFAPGSSSAARWQTMRSSLQWSRAELANSLYSWNPAARQ